MLRAFAAAFVSALAAAMLAAGCGGDGREEAVQNAERWLRAVGEGDTGRACDLMQDSAVAAIRQRSGMNPAANCVGVIRAYSGSFERGDIDRILDVGLEAEGTVKEDELGVFPVSGPRELQVILMRRGDDGWKVASTTLGPTAPSPKKKPGSSG